MLIRRSSSFQCRSTRWDKWGLVFETGVGVKHQRIQISYGEENLDFGSHKLSGIFVGVIAQHGQNISRYRQLFMHQEPRVELFTAH